MTRQEELASIGYYRIVDISKMIGMHHDTVRHRIAKLKLVPFEKWYYSEEQILLIKYE